MKNVDLEVEDSLELTVRQKRRTSQSHMAPSLDDIAIAQPAYAASKQRVGKRATVESEEDEDGYADEAFEND